MSQAKNFCGLHSTQIHYPLRPFSNLDAVARQRSAAACKGSPLSTAMAMQEGSPGIGANLFSDSLRSTPIPSACATQKQTNNTARNLIVFLLRKYIRSTIGFAMVIFIRACIGVCFFQSAKCAGVLIEISMQQRSLEC